MVDRLEAILHSTRNETEIIEKIEELGWEKYNASIIDMLFDFNMTSNETIFCLPGYIFVEGSGCDIDFAYFNLTEMPLIDSEEYWFFVLKISDLTGADIYQIDAMFRNQDIENKSHNTSNMTDDDFEYFMKKLTKMTNNFTSMPDLCDEKFVNFTANYSDVLEAMAEDIWN